MDFDDSVRLRASQKVPALRRPTALSRPDHHEIEAHSLPAELFDVGQCRLEVRRERHTAIRERSEVVGSRRGVPFGDQKRLHRLLRRLLGVEQGADPERVLVLRACAAKMLDQDVSDEEIFGGPLEPGRGDLSRL